MGRDTGLLDHPEGQKHHKRQAIKMTASQATEVQQGLEPSLPPVCCVLYTGRCLCSLCEGSQAPESLQIAHQAKEAPLGPLSHHVQDLYR